MEKETMVAIVPKTEIVDEQQLSRDVTDIEFQAESLVIQTDEDYAFAGEFGKMLKKKASQVTTFQRQRLSGPQSGLRPGKGHADPAAQRREDGQAGDERLHCRAGT